AAPDHDQSRFANCSTRFLDGCSRTPSSPIVSTTDSRCHRWWLPGRTIPVCSPPDLDFPALRPWFEDLTDHVLRAGEWTESLRDLLASAFDTNLSLTDARLN